ncbi:MAG: type III pantothenate kinase [Kiritimatiellae bacterium]|nr:type III pantothenate kinase [Kiritimatiellia bacterium]
MLVIDVGNTSTALGIWRSGRVGGIVHCDGDFAESFGAADRLIAKYHPEAIAYVSVVPAKDAKWARFAKSRGLRLCVISCDAYPGKLCYDNPRAIGADRLADAAGAIERYGAPVLVMDFGTALTAAVVTSDSVWRGGAIAPGFPVMGDYLNERTAKLPKIELGKGKAPKIGRSTEEAMRFGALVGYRGMVKEIVAQLKANFNEDFRLVATGGYARWALKNVGLDFRIDPDLTLFGAGLLASRQLKLSPSRPPQNRTKGV